MTKRILGFTLGLLLIFSQGAFAENWIVTKQTDLTRSYVDIDSVRLQIGMREGLHLSYDKKMFFQTSPTEGITLFFTYEFFFSSRSHDSVIFRKNPSESWHTPEEEDIKYKGSSSVIYKEMIFALDYARTDEISDQKHR